MTPGPPERPGQSSPAGGLGEAAAGFAVGLLLSSLGAALGAIGTGYRAGGASGAPLGVTVGGVVGLWTGLLAAVAVASRRDGRGGVASFVGLRFAGIRDVVGGAAVGLASQYLLVPLVYLPAEWVFPSIAHQLSRPAQRDTAAVHGLPATAVLLLVLAVGAPVVEEMFFRGLVLRGLSGRVGGGAAVVTSASVFALAHFQAVQSVGLAAFGVVLAVLVRRCGRLGPSIAAHAAFNATAVLSLVH